MPRTHQRARSPGSSEFSRRTVHLFSGTTLLSDRKFSHCRNSAFHRNEEISSVKGPRGTFYSIRFTLYAGRAEKVSSIENFGAGSPVLRNYCIYINRIYIETL